MIENKQIVITKYTSFDKGWALVAPFVMPNFRNNGFRPLPVSDVVRAITYADTVNLILCEPCLSGAIIKELIWANQYLKINIIAKDSSISNKYSQLNFSSQKTDDNINFNYIAIEGKINAYALITDCYIATNERINDVYFKNAPIKRDIELPKNTTSVIVADECNGRNYDDIFALCKKSNIPLLYIVGANAYTQETVRKYKTQNVTLLCVQRVRDGILFTTADGALFYVNRVGSGEFVAAEIYSFAYFFDMPYKNSAFPAKVDVKDIPADSYVCINGEIKQLRIKKVKAINRTVQTDSMGDFLSEKFDRSEVETYNEYSTEAECVIYSFTLIPPKLRPEAYSDIYNEAEELYARWQEVMRYPLHDVILQLCDARLQDSRTYTVCSQINGFHQRIAGIVENRLYENFYPTVRSIYTALETAVDNILSYCEELFSKVGMESEETKFDKIDEEIADYQRTIAEKRQLIADGRDVLSSKRRIEILEKKINDLLLLKQKFSDNAAERDSRAREEFKIYCTDILRQSGKNELQNVNSIENVITSTQTTRLSKLQYFITSYLRGFYDFLQEAKSIAGSMAKLDIPTDYVVYEQCGKRVIVIEREQEYYETEEIQKRFHLHCVVAAGQQEETQLELLKTLKRIAGGKKE